MQSPSALDWTIAQAKHLFQALLNLFNISLFTFGGEKFSFGSITELIVQALVVLLIAGAIKQLRSATNSAEIWIGCWHTGITFCNYLQSLLKNHHELADKIRKRIQAIFVI